MPKKTSPPRTPQEQHQRFVDAVRALETAGELSPTAEADFERTLAKAKRAPEIDGA